MNEVWKYIEGYEGLYQISNLGRVKSIDRIDEAGRKLKGRIRKLRFNKNGYVQINLYKNKLMKMHNLHRLVALNFLPNPENKEEVNHIDGDKRNNQISNLEWSTRKENANHAYTIGLMKTGENNHYSKLKEKQVREIRYLNKKDPVYYTLDVLKEKYGVSKGLVSMIINRKVWKHIL